MTVLYVYCLGDRAGAEVRDGHQERLPGCPVTTVPGCAKTGMIYLESNETHWLSVPDHKENMHIRIKSHVKDV